MGTLINCGESAFAYYGISNFSTSNSMPTTLGEAAFDRCYHLTSVNLIQTQTIPSSAFRFCRNITVLHLPAATSIGNIA
jgi:hypothetical protein